MPLGPRYAIYFVPAADSDFYRFGSSIMGRDCRTGSAVRRPAAFAAELQLWDELTSEPRRYGFHATLKAPFHLIASCTEAQLRSALQSFAGLGHAVPVLAPKIEMLSGFAAVVPASKSAAISGFANNCATIFDALRAPMTAAERARRVAMGLSQHQVRNLDRWGYPYLFSEFRFHMTLTGPVAPDRHAHILDCLRQEFGRTCAGQPVAIDRIALLRQDNSRAAFRIIDEATLLAAARSG